MVRLADSDLTKLLKATKECFGDTASLWVFGSRADDSKRGGDIDLYIETDLSSGLIKASLKLRRHLEAIFGEQKVDLVTRSRLHPLGPFHLIAKQTGVEITS